jgi:hypothetical protein
MINLENIRKQIQQDKEFKKFSEQSEFIMKNLQLMEIIDFAFVYNEMLCLIVIVDLVDFRFILDGHTYTINETNLVNEIKYIVNLYLE